MELNPLPLVLLLISNIHSGQTQEIKPTLTVWPQHPVFTGETLTLSCWVHQSTGWFIFITPHGDSSWTEGNKTISSVRVSDGGVYRCRAGRRDYPYHTQDSDPVTVTVKALPRATVTVTPDRSVFTGETVTLKCEIEDHYSDWRYQWYKGYTAVSKSERYSVDGDTLTIRGATQSDQDQFSCRGERDRRPQTSQSSSYVYLIVTDLPRATVSVTPDRSVFTGETVTLKCEIKPHYSGWRYQWYKHRTGNSVVKSQTNIFTIKSQSDQDEFWCRGERDGRPSSSQESDHVTLSVKESKPKAELRSDHEGAALTGNTVTLRCHMGQSTGWRFYWYKHTLNTEETTAEINSYTISSVTASDEGQFWCRAGRGNPVYYTDYSDALWVNVTVSRSLTGLIVGVTVGLSFMFLIIFFLVLLRCYKNNKGKGSQSPSAVNQQQNISLTSEQKQSESEYTSAQYGEAPVYDSVDATDKKDSSTEVTPMGPSDAMYSQVNFKTKKLKSKDNVSGAADLTYAEIELKPKKDLKKKKEKKGNNSEGEDTVYSKLKKGGDKDNVSGADDVTYAEIELKPKKDLKKKKEKKGKLKKGEDQDVASGSNDVTYAPIK